MKEGNPYLQVISIINNNPLKYSLVELSVHSVKLALAEVPGDRGTTVKGSQAILSDY